MTEENEKLSPLPQGWIWTRLEELADVVDVDHKMPRSVKDGFYFISPKDFVDPEGIDFENAKRISEEDFQKLSRKCKPESGDLIYSRIGTIGKVRKVPRDALFHVSYSLCLIKPVDTLKESDILYVFLKSPSVLKQALAKRRSIGVPDLGLGDIKKFMIPLVPLNEQKRIVGRAEELSSRLAGGVEGLRKVKAQLKRYRQAVLKYAFEGKLTEDWRKTHKDQIEPATKLLERIDEERKKQLGPKYKELPRINIADLSELPENWTWTRLGEIVFLSNERCDPTISEDERFVGLEHIQGGTGKLLGFGKSSITRSTKNRFKQGDLLYGKLRPYLNKVWVSNFDGVCSTDILVFQKNNFISNEYLAICLLNQNFVEYTNQHMSGVQHPRVSYQILSQYILPLPPLLEQLKIAEEIQRSFFITEEAERATEQSLRQAESLRQSILKTAFEGKLVPQDSSDEPAIKLLERIREERTKPKGEKETRRMKNKPRQLELSTYVK